jgi:3-deoxy-manno-octulosonate cytidylyltransferase (CMP-KDO synthetase)
VVCEQAQALSCNKTILVATDDERIIRTVEQAGFRAMMTRSDHQSGTDRCAEAMAKVDDEADIVLNLQGDEPFIRTESLEALLSCFNDPHVQMASLCRKIDSLEEAMDTNTVKVVKSLQGSALYFSRLPLPFHRDATKQQTYYKHIGVYAFKPTVLSAIASLPPTYLEQAESLEQLRWLENGYSIHMVETLFDSKGIDTPQDLSA